VITAKILVTPNPDVGQKEAAMKDNVPSGSKAKRTTSQTMHSRQQWSRTLFGPKATVPNLNMKLGMQTLLPPYTFVPKMTNFPHTENTLISRSSKGLERMKS